MPSKKKKYNARFPAGRIKKIMQTDEEVGKVAQAVPVIISRTLELFVESLLTKSMQITQARNAKTLTPSHMKQCILSESRFDFLKDLVKNVPDATAQEDSDNNANADNLALDYALNKPSTQDQAPSITPSATVVTAPVSRSLSVEAKPNSTSVLLHFQQQLQSTSVNRESTSNTPSVIQYGPKVNTAAAVAGSPATLTAKDASKLNFSIESLVKKESSDKAVELEEPKIHIDLSHLVPQNAPADEIPPLDPLSTASAPSTMFQSQNAAAGGGNGDNLYIDEDYDN